MIKFKVLSAAWVIAAMLATPAMARTNHEALRPLANDAHHFQQQDVIFHPNQAGAVPTGWYRFPGYAPVRPEQNRNLDPSNYGGDLAPESR